MHSDGQGMALNYWHYSATESFARALWIQHLLHQQLLVFWGKYDLPAPGYLFASQRIPGAKQL
jgi:hypothetical protein